MYAARPEVRGINADHSLNIFLIFVDLIRHLTGDPDGLRRDCLAAVAASDRTRANIISSGGCFRSGSSQTRNGPGGA